MGKKRIGDTTKKMGERENMEKRNIKKTAKKLGTLILLSSMLITACGNKAPDDLEKTEETESAEEAAKRKERLISANENVGYREDDDFFNEVRAIPLPFKPVLSERTGFYIEDLKDMNEDGVILTLVRSPEEYEKMKSNKMYGDMYSAAIGSSDDFDESIYRDPRFYESFFLTVLAMPSNSGADKMEVAGLRANIIDNNSGALGNIRINAEKASQGTGTDDMGSLVTILQIPKPGSSIVDINNAEEMERLKSASANQPEGQLRNRPTRSRQNLKPEDSNKDQ